MLRTVRLRSIISQFSASLRCLSTSPVSHSDPFQSANPDSFDPTTVLDTLRSYSNHWTRALEFFYWVENHHGFCHTRETCNSLIDTLGKFFEFDLVWGVITRMPTPDHVTFRILFKRYAAARLVREAMDAFERSAEFGLRDEACFHHLIDALCEHRHVVEVEELCLKRNPPFPVGTKIHNMILRGWYKMQWWRKCRDYWEEMDRKGVKKDLCSYTIYMDIMSKSGKPWKAVRLYKEMKSKGIALDVVAYNTAVQAVGLSNGVDFAIRMYREMLESGHRPNAVTHNIILKLLCEAGRFREAYSFVSQMKKMDYEPDAMTYHCFFRSLSRPNEIIRLFENMTESGTRPIMDTYVMLLKKFGNWGFLRPVFFIWKAMEEHGCSPNEFAYNALIDALVQKGMIDMARTYEKEMLAKDLSAKPRKDLGTMALVSEAEDDNSLKEDVFEHARL